jgi:hypothetical protein
LILFISRSISASVIGARALGQGPKAFQASIRRMNPQIPVTQTGQGTPSLEWPVSAQISHRAPLTAT